ncbi:Putative DNA-binding protein [hydrothermal vent metagenome]|uniref:DNA-binding protein n=1 Tax=hydrothermal vent metagenome TaxID=652676 RepID=A0A3B1B6I8_9ZZZZ
MKEYEFALKFALQDESTDPETYIEQLGAEGCGDALIGIGQHGRIALNFTREANSAYEAISSAISDVKRVIPHAKLIEATPDFVGLTDVAELLGFSRQNMRKLMLSSRAEFPTPVHEGKSSIWHLCQILAWLRDKKTYQIEDTLLEIAQTNMQVNAVKEASNIDPLLQGNLRTLVM